MVQKSLKKNAAYSFINHDITEDHGPYRSTVIFVVFILYSFSFFKSRFQSRNTQFLFHVCIHGKTDCLTTETVKNRSNIKLSVLAWHPSYISQPLLTGDFAVKSRCRRLPFRIARLAEPKEVCIPF